MTGSCHQLRMDDEYVLQGAETFPESHTGTSSLAIDSPLGGIRARFAIRVHVSRVGRISYLPADGFNRPNLCNELSAKFLLIVLADGLKLGFRRDQKQVERYLKLIKQRIVALPGKQWFTQFGTKQLNAHIRLQWASHILGSAYVEVDPQYSEVSDKKRVVFSGDLAVPHASILPTPKPPYKTDILIIEGTCGDHLREDLRSRRARLDKVPERALNNRGTAMSPAFSIGRTQKQLYELKGMINCRVRKESAASQSSDSAPNTRKAIALDWANLLIIPGFPLASRFTVVYRELGCFWGGEARARVAKGCKLRSFRNLLTFDSRDAHVDCGMCSCGCMVSHLKAIFDGERHEVFFVGCQAGGSPGRQIQSSGPSNGDVVFDGRRYDVCAQVHTIGGYSAHADQKGSVSFVTKKTHWPSWGRVVHREPAAKQQFSAVLQQRSNAAGRALKIVIP